MVLAAGGFNANYLQRLCDLEAVSWRGTELAVASWAHLLSEVTLTPRFRI